MNDRYEEDRKKIFDSLSVSLSPSDQIVVVAAVINKDPSKNQSRFYDHAQLGECLNCAIYDEIHNSIMVPCVKLVYIGTIPLAYTLNLWNWRTIVPFPGDLVEHYLPDAGKKMLFELQEKYTKDGSCTIEFVQFKRMV